MVDKTRFDGIRGKDFEGIGPRQREIYDYIKRKGSVPYKQIVADKGSISPFSKGHEGYDGPRVARMGFDELLKKLKVRGLVTSKNGVYTVVTTDESGDSSIVGLSSDLAGKYGGEKVTTLGFLAYCNPCRKVYRPGDETVFKSGAFHYCSMCGKVLESVTPEDLQRRGIR